MELLEKFKHLEENIKILKEIKNTLSINDIKSNKRHEWEIRYGLLESIQLIIDISCKITSHYNLGNPKSYKECIELLNNLNSTEYRNHNKMRFFIGDDKFLPDFLVNCPHFVAGLHQKNLSKHMGNLILPEGKPKNGQSFLNKILELATASTTNLI